MRKGVFARAAIVYVLGLLAAPYIHAQISAFWEERDIKPTAKAGTKVRIGVWDSGVDIDLFKGRTGTTAGGKILLRGYDSYKLRKDTALAILPTEYGGRRDELNADLKALDDLDSGTDSLEAKALDERLKRMSKKEEDEFFATMDRWSGYSHGTAVADIAIAGNPHAEIVIARMEWWHGSPPVPCWSRELADREAKSIGDLLDFLVRNGARVVNMSWGRFQSSYTSALKECAPKMPEAERTELARYTVDKIRLVLQTGMAKSPQVLFVGAAGNAGTSLQAANPATRFSLPNFLIIGAVDRNGEKTKFTNTGPEVTLYANGERVPARLVGGAISYPSGTSMAAPNVTNAAAKLLALHPRLSGAELRSLLEQTADLNKTGQNLLNTAKAAEALSKKANAIK